MRALISLADIDDANLHLPTLSLNHTTLHPNKVAPMLAQHYARALLTVSFNILGSANFIGDPLDSYLHIEKALWLLLVAPVAGAMQGVKARQPWPVLAGLADGLLGVFVNVLYASASSVSKLSGSMQKLISMFGFSMCID